MFASLMRKRSRVRKRVASVRARNARNSGFTGVDKIVTVVLHLRMAFVFGIYKFLHCKRNVNKSIFVFPLLHCRLNPSNVDAESIPMTQRNSVRNNNRRSQREDSQTEEESRTIRQVCWIVRTKKFIVMILSS